MKKWIERIKNLSGSTKLFLIGIPHLFHIECQPLGAVAIERELGAIWKSKYRRTWRTTCLFIKPAR